MASAGRETGDARSRVHGVHVHDRLAGAAPRREADELRVELAGREDPERDRIQRVGTDQAGVRNLKYHVRGGTRRQRHGQLRAAVRRRQPDLVAVDIKRRDARVTEERARRVPDVAELQLEEHVARGTVTWQAVPDPRVRRGTARHRRIAGGACGR